MKTWSKWAVLLALVLSAACGKKDDGAACTVAADCSDGEICTSGTCSAPNNANNENNQECVGTPDCPGGFMCVANMCEQIPLDMGDNNNNGMDMGSPNNGDDMNFDNIPPEVVSVMPADQSVDVALDSDVTVVFNEALRETSVNIQSIEIRDPANNAIPADITLDNTTFTVTLSPQAPLRQATPYRLVVTVFVRDAADNALAQEFESKFYTEYPEPTGIRAVAERWAPHIYQGIGDTSGGNVNVDLPTTVDFDGNQKARDNKSGARLNTTRNTAAVYYSVVESKTHYFITYSMYYPLRLVGQDDFEHDFTGAVMVVDKASDMLVLVDGVKVQPGADTNIGFTPSGSPVTGTGQPQQLDGFDVGALEDGTHYPMFVPAGEHEACAFPIDGNPPVCLHNGGEFPGDGVLLKPGDVGQEYDDAVMPANPLYPATPYLEMTYELVPLPSTLWVRRTDIGTELLWQQTQFYTPSGEDRPEVTSGGAQIVVPTFLFSDDGTTYGKPPFQWLRTSTENNAGQWLFDPAYLLLNKYDFGMGEWSQEYCFNVFFDVNLRGDAANPECESDT